MLSMSRCVSAAFAAGVVIAGAQALPPNFVDRELDIAFNQAVGVRFASDASEFINAYIEAPPERLG